MWGEGFQGEKKGSKCREGEEGTIVYTIKGVKGDRGRRAYVSRPGWVWGEEGK